MRFTALILLLGILALAGSISLLHMEAAFDCPMADGGSLCPWGALAHADMARSLFSFFPLLALIFLSLLTASGSLPTRVFSAPVSFALPAPFSELLLRGASVSARGV